MRAVVVPVGLVLVAGLLVSAGGTAGAAPEDDPGRLSVSAPGLRAVPHRNAPVDARVGNLTSRPAGDPGTDGRRLSSASVRQDLVRKRTSATVVLDAVPTAATAAVLYVEFGHLSGTTCEGDVGASSPTVGAMSAGFARSGRTVTMDLAESEAGYETWNCAFAVLHADGVVQSALVGGLSNVYARPRLKVGKPEQLGRKVKRLPLVRGVWTVVTVPVANTARADAVRVRVTGSGRGLRVRPAVIQRVYATSDATTRIQVKRVGAKVGRLRLAVRGANAAAVRRNVATRAVRAPQRPTPGRYATADGRITFRITGGARRKITEFRAYTMTTCGGFPDVFTYTMNYYDFPSTVIARNGIVDRTKKAKLYSVSLRLRAVRGKVTSARFAYYGPNRCFAVNGFTAKRVRR